uniref:Uncharacterized protein n=1 Tax=Arundo donax TaxID=35708 RepID=A0A0A9CY05_ARUDO
MKGVFDTAPAATSGPEQAVRTCRTILYRNACSLLLTHKHTTDLIKRYDCRKKSPRNTNASSSINQTCATSRPSRRRASRSRSMAVLGAEAAAAEAAALAALEPLRPADVGAVVPAHARALELVALRLARPRLRHRHRPKLCGHEQQQDDEEGRQELA